jgi:dienelactone hydrolase
MISDARNARPHHGDIHSVTIPVREAKLAGDLVVPPGARGIVLFAHGSGSSRLSPRNRQVASTLQEAGLATLLFDLLTPLEEREDRLTLLHRFDLPLLARRLVAATDWVHRLDATRALSIGYFGASTGAGAALIAASERPAAVHAVVSRGGRPDLAGLSLPNVSCPTLLLVGARDPEVIRLNENALARMHCVRSLEIIPDASHLFEEPGTLDQVAHLAVDWFMRYLGEATPDVDAPPGARAPASPGRG